MNTNITGSVEKVFILRRLRNLRRKIPETPWGSPIPIGDGDGDVNRFPDGDGDGDGDGDRDEAEKRG
ncbi:hypothetical protein Tco_1188795 [Tanacetum coccineum]